MAVNWGEVGGAAAGSAAKGLIGSLFGFAQARQNWKFQKKQMQLAQQYEKEAFDWETQRQDYLLENQQAINKAALQKAGYSTADPNGTGVTTAATPDMGAAAPSTSQYMQMGEFENPITSYLALKQADLMSSQSKLAQEQAGKTKNEAEKIKQDFDFAKERFPEEIQLLKASWFEKQKAGELHQKDIEKLTKDIEQISKSIQLMDIDIKWADKFKSKDYSKLGNEVALLMKENRIKEAEAKLADYGILVGADGLTTLCGVIASGKSGEIMPELSKAIAQVVASLPAAIKQFVIAVKDSIEKDASGAWNDLKKWAKGVEDMYKGNRQHDDSVRGEDVAKQRDDEFLTAQDNEEYKDMSDYIYAHADKDADGNIDNDDWEYWKRKYFRSKRK